MDLIYKSKRGKQIVFDDFEDNIEEYQKFWVEMCPHCHNKYKGILGNRVSTGAMGTCSVKGCENEAEYYVDFAENEVEHSAYDLIGMRMDFIELDNIMMHSGFYSEGKYLDGEVLENIIESGSICYTHKKKNDEPGKQVKVSFEVLLLADKTVESLSATKIKVTAVEDI